MLSETLLQKPKLAFAGFCLVWVIVAFLHLRFWSMPWMDTYCYASPAAAASHPFVLHLPFLGSFMGADHAWGLHWPGGPLFLSLLLPQAFSAAWLIAVYVFLWLLCGLACALLAFQLSRSYWVAFISLAVILLDRSALGIAGGGRHEFLTAIFTILPLICVLSEDRKTSVPARTFLALSLFLLPLLHPMGVGIGVVYVLSAILMLPDKLRNSTDNKKQYLLFLICFPYVLGLSILVGWFALQPDVWRQFQAHAKEASGGVKPFEIYWKAATQFYYPFSTGTLIYVIALVSSFGVFLQCAKALFLKMHFPLLKIWFPHMVFLMTFGGMSFMANAYYLFISLPVATALSVAFVANFLSTHSHLISARVVALTALLFLLFHGAFLVSRSIKVASAGFPDLRNEARQFYDSLPSTHLKLIPISLWEVALENRDQAMLNTQGFAANDINRIDYESYAWGELQHPDDIVIIDHLQTVQVSPIRVPSIDEGWEMIAEKKSIMPSSKPWGFHYQAWRRKPDAH